MPRPLLRHRRAVGRPASARFHGYEATCGRVRAQPSAVLAGTPWRHDESQRRANALAHRKRAVTAQPIRFARTWIAGMGCRAVPIAERSAWPLGHRA